MHKTLVLRAKRRPVGSSAPEWEEEPLGAGLPRGQEGLGLRFRHNEGKESKHCPAPSRDPRRTHAKMHTPWGWPSLTLSQPPTGTTALRRTVLELVPSPLLTPAG